MSRTRSTAPVAYPLTGIATLAALAFPLIVASGDLRAQATRDSPDREPIISLPCEGCEAVFQGLPDTIASGARIAPQAEPGEPMRIEGTVYDRRGEPVPGVIVYAYHTDARGIYPPNERFPGQAAYRHGELRGWARTDDRGRYRFDTIRPASYPDSDIPAHVHMHLIEPGCCTYYIESIHFADDPLLPADQRRRLREGRAGDSLVRPTRNDDGVWIVSRDIVLGEGVEGYSEKRPTG